MRLCSDLLANFFNLSLHGLQAIISLCSPGCGLVSMSAMSLGYDPGALQVHTDHYDMGMHDSDNIIPPKSTAPASIVPFARAPSSMGAYSGGSSAASSAVVAASAAALAAKHSGGSSKVPSSSFASQVRLSVSTQAVHEEVPPKGFSPGVGTTHQ